MTSGDTIDHDARLDEVIASYLEAVESGEPQDQEIWLAHHPDLADGLAEFFADHQLAHRVTKPLRTAPAPGVLGTTVGDYELLEEIGRGGMGVIYKAEQRSLNRIVAVKTILSGRLASESDIRRFRTEAESAAKLQHPNIVTVHEVGEHQGQHFFSMELVDGADLGQLVNEEPLSPETAALYSRDLAKAIDYAHGHGVLHRDLKPTNVLIDGSGRPRITDFGLAKLIANESALTSTGAILGTPSYIAPEQASGRPRTVGRLSDVYSLGAILYESLTARPPFRGVTTFETISQVLNDEPIPPRQLNPTVPVDLETICLKCLSKQPRRRYRSARALADDLDRFIRRAPIRARPIGPIGRIGRTARRHPVMTTVFAGAVALLFALNAWAALTRIDERRAQAARSNVYVARSVAGREAQELRHLRFAVVLASQDSTLRSLMARPGAGGKATAERQPLQRWVEQTHARYADPANGFVDAGDVGPFISWFILNRHGDLIAHSTDPALEHNFGWRDYFAGAMRLGPTGEQRPAYISKVYQAISAERYYKFAIAAPVHAGAVPLGIVVGTVTTATTRGTLLPRDAMQKAVLVAPQDPVTGPGAVSDDERDALNLIVGHPAFGAGDEPMVIRNRLVRDIQNRAVSGDGAVDMNYRDPVAARDPAYEGRWLAAFAPVSDTDFVVIVQQRYQEAIRTDEVLVRLLIPWGGGLLIAILALAVTSIVHRLRRART